MKNNLEKIAQSAGFKLETKGLTFKQMENKLYADSPFNLGSAKDNAYRDGVDRALELFKESLYPKQGVKS